MKMRIAILGGAFNPPTLGHIEVAQCVLKNTDIDGVWFSPCYGHLQKSQDLISTAEDRLMMCYLLTSKYDHISTSDYEVFEKLDGSVHRLLTKLNEVCAYSEFSYIIGMDQANNFHTWKKYKELMDTTRFIVVSREGEKSQVSWYNNAPHIYLNEPIRNISSTQVRQWLKEWWKDGSHEKEILANISDYTFQYIQKYKLYC